MSFFRRDSGTDDAERDESLKRIEDGGIPLGAERRLQELGQAGALFTSGLSVNEFSLLRRLGPRPLAQVMGASVVRTGWQYLPALEPGMGRASGSWWDPSVRPGSLGSIYTEPSWQQVRNYQWHAAVVCELETLTEAWTLARRRALDRLAEEALQVNADAVVGVHLQNQEHDLGRGTIEFAVSGTAIRLPDSKGTSWPVLSDLSVQDYWRLHSTGHEPTGLLSSTVVVFASPSLAVRGQRLRTKQRNQELEEVTRGFQVARQTVRARLEGQISDAHGTGAVGMELSHTVRHEKLAVAKSLAPIGGRGWGVGRLGIPYRVTGKSDVERPGWMITMHGAGTAIRRGPAPPPVPVKPAVRMGAR